MTQVSVLKIPDTAVVKSLDRFPFVPLFHGHIALCCSVQLSAKPKLRRLGTYITIFLKFL